MGVALLITTAGVVPCSSGNQSGGAEAVCVSAGASWMRDPGTLTAGPSSWRTGFTAQPG